MFHIFFFEMQVTEEVGLMQVTTVTRDLHLADCRKISDACLSILIRIFVCLCSTIVTPVCVAFCKVLQDYVELCP